MEADDRPVMGPALPPGGLPVAPDPVAPEAAVTSPMDEDVEARGPDREERLATADAARREEETDATREPGNDLEPEKVGGDSPPRARDDQVASRLKKCQNNGCIFLNSVKAAVQAHSHFT